MCHEDNEQAFMLDEEAKIIEYLENNQDLLNLGLLLLFKTGLRIGDDHVIIRLKLDKPSKYAGLS